MSETPTVLNDPPHGSERGDPIYLDYNATTPIRPEVAASTGSACHEGPERASSVILAQR